MLDADLEADRRLALGQVLVGEHLGAGLHHPDHAWRREHAGADRAADVGDQRRRDGELVAALEPGDETVGGLRHQTIPRPPLTPSVSPVT